MNEQDFKKYQFTLNVENLVTTKIEKLKKFYCREDFREFYKKLTTPGMTDASNYKFTKKRFMDLCDSFGFDGEALLNDKKLAAEKLSLIPPKKYMLEYLLKTFYKSYSKTPDRTDYMERIVRRLAPEYNDDTVRTAILKKYVIGGSKTCFKADNIIKWAEERMDPEQRQKYDELKKGKRLEYAVSFINDDIFVEKGSGELDAVDLIRLMNARILGLVKKDPDELIIDGVKGAALDDIALSEETTAALMKICGCSGSMENTELLIMFENCCINGDIDVDSDEFSAAFSLLDGDFKKEMNRIKYKNKNGVFQRAGELFKNDRKDELIKKRKGWELLYLCQDLANGCFKNTNGKTRELLYQFAIMFEMPLNLRDEIFTDPDRDAGKNLFEDYYSDNMMRFLLDEYNNRDFLKTVEPAPTGEGINLKNYVEAVYIYYINRTDLKKTPGERVDRAKWMINKIFREAKERTAAPQLSPSDKTYLYRDPFVEYALALNEKDFIEYILSSYTIFNDEGGAGGSRILVSSDENTAYERISELYKELNATSGDESENRYRNAQLDNVFIDMLRENYSEDERFMRLVGSIRERLMDDIAWISANKRRFICELLHVLYHGSSPNNEMKTQQVAIKLKDMGEYPKGSMISCCADILKRLGFDVRKRSGKEKGDPNNFLFCLGERSYNDELLDKVIGKIKANWFIYSNELESAVNELFDERFPSNKKVSRTQLMIAYANHFFSKNEKELKGMSYVTFYNTFTSELDDLLIESRFQPFNEKNVFDMYLLLSTCFNMLDDKLD